MLIREAEGQSYRPEMSSTSLQKDPSSNSPSLPRASPGLSYLTLHVNMGLVTQASSPNRWREVSSPRLHMVCRSLAGVERGAWVGAAAYLVLQAAAAAAAAEQQEAEAGGGRGGGWGGGGGSCRHSSLAASPPRREPLSASLH